MAIQSKQKGNRYEYEFADILTKIFGRNFKRNTSGSGAMFGGENFRIKLQGRDTSQVLHDLGDIVPPTGFYVVSECKNYKEFEFNKLLRGEGNRIILWDWLEEVRHDSRFNFNTEEVDLPHWLSFNITRKGRFIALPHKYFGHIFHHNIAEVFPYFIHYHTKYADETKTVRNLIEVYYIFNLDFLEQIKDDVVEVISNPVYFKDDVSEFMKESS